jgi:S-formylglutathione hydrolase FrmB
MQGARIMAMMADHSLPPMIWVFLDHSGATGTNEFADSANNGPWGKALTEELIPALERQYAMDATTNGRFLTGHSSGGWSTLWLQVRYPKVFGGSWPTSPDPSDFHNFTNIDLYAPSANFYRDAKGQPIPLVRDHGKLIATMEQFARAEAVLGSYGGQIASFEWVFSPRGANGQPVPVFDRATGKVDPAVVAYWHDNYDVANIITRDAAALRRDLNGKIHLTVGTADTFYLDGPAHLLEAAMAKVRIKASFTYLPDKTHFDLYVRGADKMALMKDNAWAMYAVARPGAKRPTP